MLKIAFAIILCIVGLVCAFNYAHAQGGTVQLQGQWTVPGPGDTAQNSMSCSGGYLVSPVGGPCTTVPAGNVIVGYAGSISIKYSGIEILAQVICNGVELWRSEMLDGPVTRFLVSPANINALGLGGECWVQYQAGNTGGTPANPAWELQFEIYYAPPSAAAVAN